MFVLFSPFRSIFPVHPSFRIIALAEPPVIGSTTQQWLGPEFLTMFFFHHMKPLVKSEEVQVIKEMVRVRLALAGGLQLLSFQDTLTSAGAELDIPGCFFPFTPTFPNRMALILLHFSEAYGRPNKTHIVESLGLRWYMRTWISKVLRWCQCC